MSATRQAASPVKVVLIDDHFLVHDSVALQLARYPEFNLVASGTAGEQLEPLIKQHAPDVVLLDLGIPAKAGTNIRQAGRFPVLPAVRRLRLQYPHTQFVILSASANAELIEGALEAEVKGYLLKDDALSLHLAEAIRAVSQGGVYFSKEVARQIVSRRPSGPAVQLTERQVEILEAVVANANLSYAEQARRLGISEATFQNHLRAIFAKLGASNVTYAVIRGIQLGVIPAHWFGLQPEENG
jgi:DNA-binding NarL/FixJ family response regulator